MSVVNNATLIGRAGKDAELRHSQAGKPIASFSLAVKRPGKDAKGNETSDWFQVSLWGKPAELAAEYVRKGALVACTGAVQIDEWTDRDGAKRTTVKLAADNFQLLESKAESQARQAAAPADDDDTPPFTP